MSANLQHAGTLPPAPNEMERRRHLRVPGPFHVKVRGKNTGGEQFELEAELDDMSAGGLYMRIPECLEVGAGVFVLIRLTTSQPLTTTRPPRVAARGIVRRAETLADGQCGVALQFRSHRFL